MSVVPIDTVKITPGMEPSSWEVRKIKPYMMTQGLIEPLKLDRRGEIGREDVHDPARLIACRELGWETVIVAIEEEVMDFKDFGEITTTTEFLKWFLKWSEWLDDKGPLGEGWQSEELMKARSFVKERLRRKP